MSHAARRGTPVEAALDDHRDAPDDLTDHSILSRDRPASPHAVVQFPSRADLKQWRQEGTTIQWYIAWTAKAIVELSFPVAVAPFVVKGLELMGALAALHALFGSEYSTPTLYVLVVVALYKYMTMCDYA